VYCVDEMFYFCACFVSLSISVTVKTIKTLVFSACGAQCASVLCMFTGCCVLGSLFVYGCMHKLHRHVYYFNTERHYRVLASCMCFLPRFVKSKRLTN